MSAEKVLERAISAIGKKNQRFTITTGRVTEVNERTCNVSRQGLPALTGVRLNSIDAEIDNRVRIIPSKGSQVQVGMIEGTNESFILATSEIDMVEVVFEDTTVEITNEGVVIDDGENGGMCITPKLKTELDKLTRRVDGIINAIKNAKPAAGSSDGGTLYQSQMVTMLAHLQKEDFSNIENQKVTH